MKIGIIDYGVGNLGSITNAFASLGIKTVISNNQLVLGKADSIILPGDGAAGEGMKNLNKMKLDNFIKWEINNKKPFLGICLGMQLLLEKSEEGSVSCLGIIEGSVEKIKTNEKLPQIGWNQIKIKNYESRIMNSIQNNSYSYFINSFICKPKDKNIVVGSTTYGEEFCTVFEKNNVFGVQFHPEKSGKLGVQMLKNFINIC